MLPHFAGGVASPTFDGLARQLLHHLPRSRLRPVPSLDTAPYARAILGSIFSNTFDVSTALFHSSPPILPSPSLRLAYDAGQL